MKKILLIITVASVTSFAQITITGSDISNMFAVGNSTTNHQDTLQSSVDIGSTGGGNNWNFISLQSNLTVELSSIDPLTSPYIAGFPTADFCLYSDGFSQGSQVEIWSYSTLNGYFDNLGTASIIDGNGSAVFSIQNDPARHTFQNPTTYNTQWMQSFTQSSYLNGSPIFSTNFALNSIVDAYGIMTLPGGASYETLRIREEMSTSAFTSVSYTFIAKNGAQVNVQATDSNPPNSGTISVDRTSYNSALSTSVEQISSLPVNYNLSQNYPNPFNPTTNIEYSIPEASFVQLKVYDVLGNEITTLINEEQSAGTYRADFSGGGLASGLYIAQLTTGNFVQTIKMSLLK